MRHLIEKPVRWLNGLATLWAFLLAFVILYDVLGRLLGHPVQGTAEIVSNSIVAVVFMQFPLAIRDGTFLRATILYDVMPAVLRRAVDGLGHVIGLGMFAAMGAGGWGDMIIGWRIHEFEGEGAFRVPVYPIRTITVTLSFVCALVYAIQLVRVLAGADAPAATDPEARSAAPAPVGQAKAVE